MKHKRIDIKHRRIDMKHRRIDMKYRIIDIKHRRIDMKHKRIDIKHRRIDMKHKRIDIKHRRIDIKHKRIDIKLTPMGFNPIFFSELSVFTVFLFYGIPRYGRLIIGLTHFFSILRILISSSLCDATTRWVEGKDKAVRPDRQTFTFNSAQFSAP